LEQNKIRWGIIGSDRNADAFIAAASLVDCCYVNASVRSRNSHAYKLYDETYFPHIYDSDLMLCNSDTVDAVYFSSPHNFNYKLALNCLMNRKHVLCANPIELSTNEGQKLLSVARANKVIFIESPWHRFLPALNTVRTLLEQNIIGEIISLSAHFGFLYDIQSYHQTQYRHPNLNQNDLSLIAHSHYPLFLADMLFEEMPLSICSQFHTNALGIDDYASFQLEFSNGRSANLFASFQQNAGSLAAIYGTQGKITIPQFLTAKSILVYDEYGNSKMQTINSGRLDKLSAHIADVCQIILSQHVIANINTPSLNKRVIRMIDKIKEQRGNMTNGVKPTRTDKKLLPLFRKINNQ